MSDVARIEHIKKIDIPAWQHGSGDWFTVKLLALIAKADGQNKERIRLGFPEAVQAYEEWYGSSD